MSPIPFDSFGDPSNPTLHFAHANGFPPTVYRQFLELLTEQYHVIAFHQRPIWDSNLPDAETNGWHENSADLIQFLDQQNARGIIGVGHSMGGVSTFYAALERPDLFSRLILIDPVFLPPAFLEKTRSSDDGLAFNPMYQAAMKRRNQWTSREEAWERFRGKKTFGRFSDTILWDYVNSITTEDGEGYKLIYPREWEAHFYAMPPLDIWDLLPQLTHDTLAIRATESNTLFPDAWELWQQRQPDAAFTELPDLGHLLMLENPSLVANTMLDWLNLS